MNKKFIFTFGRSFNPRSYPKLVKEYSLRKTYVHFIYLLVIVTLITGALYIPVVADKPEEIQEEFSKIQDVNVIIDATTSDAARFGPVTIDLDSNKTLKDRGILITRSKVEYKFLPFGASTVIKDGEISNLAKSSTTQVSLLSSIAIFLAPYLLILLYGYHLIKYTLIVLIMGTLIIILIRTSRGEIHAKPVYKAGFLATPFLMMELPLQTMTSSWFYHSLTPFLLFVIFYLVTIFFLKPEVLEGESHSHHTQNSILGRSTSSKISNVSKDGTEYVDGDIFAGSNFKKDFKFEKF